MITSGLTIILGLIALSSGVSLLIWGMRNEGKGVHLAKIIGFIISLISTLIIVSTIYITFFASYEMKKMMNMGCPMCNMMKKEDHSAMNLQNKMP